MTSSRTLHHLAAFLPTFSNCCCFILQYLGNSQAHTTLLSLQRRGAVLDKWAADCAAEVALTLILLQFTPQSRNLHLSHYLAPGLPLFPTLPYLLLRTYTLPTPTIFLPLSPIMIFWLLRCQRKLWHCFRFERGVFIIFHILLSFLNSLINPSHLYHGRTFS